MDEGIVIGERFWTTRVGENVKGQVLHLPDSPPVGVANIEGAYDVAAGGGRRRPDLCHGQANTERSVKGYAPIHRPVPFIASQRDGAGAVGHVLPHTPTKVETRQRGDRKIRHTKPEIVATVEGGERGGAVVDALWGACRAPVASGGQEWGRSTTCPALRDSSCPALRVSIVAKAEAKKIDQFIEELWVPLEITTTAKVSASTRSPCIHEICLPRHATDSKRRGGMLPECRQMD